ncbi:MAG TPA: hypothetical protein V6D08_20235 [Candidatus Obscuribacterales bacterium]
MREFSFVLLLLLFAGIVLCAAKESVPLKVIAPDLVIESVEQGEFLDDPADPRHFRRTDVVPRKNRYLFGWRMKVKTTRKSILVQERGPAGKGHNGVPFQAVPKHGYIFQASDIVAGVSPGKYSATIYVENVPVTTVTSTVK